MGSRLLEVNVISACNLQDIRFRTLKVYVGVHLSNNPTASKHTPIDTEGSTNPTWNSEVTMKFILTESALQQNNLSLKLQLFRNSHVSSSKPPKVIGEVSVSISELLDKAGNTGHTLTKDLSSGGGGKITFWYKIGEPGEKVGSSGSRQPQKKKKKKSFMGRVGGEVVQGVIGAAIAVGLGFVIDNLTGEGGGNDEGDDEDVEGDEYVDEDVEGEENVDEDENQEYV